MARILIIDDDEKIRKFLANLTAKLGHESIQAGTCAEALALLESPGVDIVIADIFLPDTPEFMDWVQRLKERAASRPLILITGEPTRDLVEMVKRQEVRALLTKPFELAFIKNLLMEITGGQDPRGQGQH